jgi:hypothetical protein
MPRRAAKAPEGRWNRLSKLVPANEDPQTLINSAAIACFFMASPRAQQARGFGR